MDRVYGSGRERTQSIVWRALGVLHLGICAMIKIRGSQRPFLHESPAHPMLN